MHITFQGPVEKSSGYTYVATSDGLLYFINTVTRTVEKVIQIHDGEVAEMKTAKNFEYITTVSK